MIFKKRMRLLFSTSIGTQEDADWPKVFATSPFISPLALLIFRACSAATFLGHMLAHIGHWWYRGWAYCIYLTNWALMLQTSSECLLFILALRGYRILRTQGARGGGGLPKTARVAMVLWSTAAPMSLSVTLLFFLLINPVWNLRPIVYVAFFAHFLNWFLLLIGLFVSRIPFSMRHLGWSLLFAATFIIWTVLHFYLKIGRNEPCVDYAMQDCPIYGEFDWHHPQRTAMTSLAAIAGLMMASGIYSGLVRCRDACDSLSDAQTSFRTNA